MKREPTKIDQPLRAFVVQAIVDKLQLNGVEVLIASVDAKHLHLLARFSDHQTRHWIGVAKKHVSLLLRQEGLREDAGGLWAKRSRAEPIKDRGHQLSTFRYISAHASRGAALWRFNAKPARSK
jgi:REP element-mobilizing transposase RayT